MKLFKAIALESRIRELERQNEILARRNNEWQDRACYAEFTLDAVVRLWRHWAKAWPDETVRELAQVLEMELKA